MFRRLLILDIPISSLWYAIGVIVCIDVPLAASFRGHSAVNFAFYLPLMAWVTARRLVGFPWSRWWSVPYSFLALSPCSTFLFDPGASLWLITLCVLVLQVPAILWSPGREIDSRPEAT
jgi:hypothetical protein